MLNATTLAASGEHMTILDEDALASVVGGDGWKEWVAKQVVTFVVDCLLNGIDNLIEAAEEGYEDAR